MGARWLGDHSSERSIKFAISSKLVQVLPMHGSAEAKQDIRPILTVHGFVVSSRMGSKSSKASWKCWLTLKLPKIKCANKELDPNASLTTT